ncbi:hypothetical protein [Roseibium alexandrii]|jgi:hypothetical protein|uniref:Flagellar basal body-associated protein FliL n=2 Tax=Roseibium alexandrii TaxID=388408 RepID=A0A0M7AKQ1_9HYPH|nr:hypothetical protein [Roseibium alexandrii]EEE45558.1 hypothetical protein SADFL11_2847 [Roseibium alexandrii DFL-11]CTQ74986.1 hypothetical protein LAX5112_04072 [Roseibium alexandrii]
MIKMLVAGVWMSIAMLISGYGTAKFISAQNQTNNQEETAYVGLDYETLKPVNVPILFEGALQGYVVAKLVFTADGDTLRKLPVPPHPFLVDEAFRALYADETLDFRNLERYDLDGLTEHLKTVTNKRIGQKVVQDVLVEEFNYFDKADVLSH